MLLLLLLPLVLLLVLVLLSLLLLSVVLVVVVVAVVAVVLLVAVVVIVVVFVFVFVVVVAVVVLAVVVGVVVVVIAGVALFGGGVAAGVGDTGGAAGTGGAGRVGGAGARAGARAGRCGPCGVVVVVVGGVSVVLVSACKDETIRLFPYRYGDPDKLLHACHEGRRFLSEKYTQGWFCDISLISHPLMVDAYNKSHMLAEEDKQSIRAYDSWVFGADSAGRLYLFPQSDSKVSLGEVRLGLEKRIQRLLFAVVGASKCFYGLDLGTLSIKEGRGGALAACCGCLQPGNMAAGLSSGHLQLVDLELAKPVCMIPSHSAMVRNVKADWTTNEVASCSYDGFINLVDARTTKTVRRLKGKGQWDAMDVCFDKQIALAASKFEPTTTLWDLRSGQVVREYDARRRYQELEHCKPASKSGNLTIDLPGHRPNCINVDWKTMTACTGADDGKVMFWDLETGEVSQTIDCEHFLTQSLDICWSRGLLLTGSFDYQFKLWDVKPCGLFDVDPKATALTLRPLYDRLRLGLEELCRKPEGHLHYKLARGAGSVTLTYMLRRFAAHPVFQSTRWELLYMSVLIMY
eukprot:s6324_g2.t1